MPELPDLTIYIEALERHIGGAVLERVRIASPSLLHTVDPPISQAEGLRVTGVQRIAKRVAIGLEGDLHLVFHLMIAGRFRWKKKGCLAPPVSKPRTPQRQSLTCLVLTV